MSVLRFIENDKFKIVFGSVFFAAALVVDAVAISVAAVILYSLALAFSGLSVYIDAVRGVIRRDFLDEKFLMSIASIGAVIVGEISEAVAVMLFFAVGEAFEHRAVAASRKKIRALMDICPDTATVIRNDEEIKIDAEDVEVGEIVVIKSGERVPVDAVVVDGSADIDTSPLTGESIPRAAVRGDKIESGCVVIGGILRCEVLRPASESSAMRILEMVENADERKAKEENFITAFARVYTPIVVFFALILATVPSLIGITEWSDSIYRALIFLVVSCPCALVISVPLAFFGGIGAMASRGILFKGGSYFSPIARAENAVFDKTGTLTTGKFEVVGARVNTVDEEELYNLAASVEYVSSHPIAEAIVRRAKHRYIAEDVREFCGMGTVGKVNGELVSVGNSRLMESISVDVTSDEKSFVEAVVYVARGEKLLGAIVISDEIKPEAAHAIAELSKCGISRTVMLTGDKRDRAEKIAKKLSLDEVKAELLPENKLAELEKIIDESDGKTLYVGDGINDAPSLTLSDVGIAMGGIGSDSAIECADVVITSDNLDKIPEAIRGARKTLRIARENIVFALGIKVCVLALSAVGIANMWLAVFSDVGVAVIAILNSMRVMKK